MNEQNSTAAKMVKEAGVGEVNAKDLAAQMVERAKANAPRPKVMNALKKLGSGADDEDTRVPNMVGKALYDPATKVLTLTYDCKPILGHIRVTDKGAIGFTLNADPYSIGIPREDGTIAMYRVEPQWKGAWHTLKGELAS